MRNINRLNLTSSYGALSMALCSPLSDLGSDDGKPDYRAMGKQAWDTMDEEQRQAAFDQVKTLVASGDEDLDDYKNAYKDAFEADTTLADDDIIWCVAMVNDDDAEGIALQMKVMEDNGIAEGDENDADEVLKEVQAATGSLADKLGNDGEFKDEMALIIKSKEVIARGPVTILLHLERILDAGDWAKIPEPGSKKPAKDKPSNITLWDIEVTKRGNRKINVSFFDTLNRSIFPQGYADLEDIKETFKSTDERKIDNAQRKEYMKLPFLKRKSMLRTYTVRVSTSQDMIKRAVRVRNLRAALKDTTNKEGKHPIGCDFVWETYPIKANDYKGVLLPGNSPIQVYDALAPSITEKLGESYTVMTFLKFEAGLKKMLAGKAEPSFSELAATLDRDKESAANKKRLERFTVDNMADFLFSMVSNANYIDNAENLRAFKKHLESLKKKNDDKADPRLMTEYEHELFLFGSMMMNLQSSYSYVKGSGFDALWEANKKGEKLTHDDILTEQDEKEKAEKLKVA